MSSVVQNQENNPEQQPGIPSNPADFELPARYRHDDTLPCMLFSEYSVEAREALKKVQAKAQEWFGDKSSHQDSGRLFEMSMTLFLTPAQRTELSELIKETPLAVYAVKDLALAIERGARGEDPWVDPSANHRQISTLQACTNAGHAMAELTSSKDLPWERQRALTFDLWNGISQLQSFAVSMLKNVQTDITGSLIARAEAAQQLSNEANIFDAARKGIYREAARRTVEYAREAGHMKEVQDAMLPLARVLLTLPSPILKEVVFAQMESAYSLLGHGLGLYGTDPQPMLECLDNWKAFWDTQIPLLSRYFAESAAEKALARTAEGSETTTEEPESAWRCSGRYQGGKVALSPFKWEETVFQEIRSEHLWGLKLFGVPGVIGDRAFQVVSDVLASANAEALACQPAYGQTLVERETSRFGDLNSLPAESRQSYERYIAVVTKEKLAEAGRLVHGVSDLFVTSLSWSLPQVDMPLAFDPVLHLERTMTLLEGAMQEEERSPGLAYTACLAARELAIQLSHWDHLTVLDTRPELAARTKKLFEDAEVYLPDEWCASLRERGILPPAKPENDASEE